ncbi:hypothetical protein VTN02DRAFT_1914 [Thermoascus thermophilus]
MRAGGDAGGIGGGVGVVFAIGFEVLLRYFLEVCVAGMLARERGSIVEGHRNRQRAGGSNGCVVNHGDLIQGTRPGSFCPEPWAGEDMWSVPPLRSTGKYEAAPRNNTVESPAIKTTTMAALKKTRRLDSRGEAGYRVIRRVGGRGETEKRRRNRPGQPSGDRRDEMEMVAEAIAYSRSPAGPSPAAWRSRQDFPPFFSSSLQQKTTPDNQLWEPLCPVLTQTFPKSMAVVSVQGSIAQCSVLCGRTGLSHRRDRALDGPRYADWSCRSLARSTGAKGGRRQAARLRERIHSNGR